MSVERIDDLLEEIDMLARGILDLPPVPDDEVEDDVVSALEKCRDDLQRYDDAVRDGTI